MYKYHRIPISTAVSNVVSAVIEEVTSYVLNEQELSKRNVGKSVAKVIESGTAGAIISRSTDTIKVLSKLNKGNDINIKKGIKIVNHAFSGAVSFIKNLIHRASEKKQTTTTTVYQKRWWQ